MAGLWHYSGKHVGFSGCLFKVLSSQSTGDFTRRRELIHRWIQMVSHISRIGEESPLVAIPSKKAAGKRTWNMRALSHYLDLFARVLFSFFWGWLLYCVTAAFSGVVGLCASCCSLRVWVFLRGDRCRPQKKGLLEIGPRSETCVIMCMNVCSCVYVYIYIYNYIYTHNYIKLLCI